MNFLFLPFLVLFLTVNSSHISLETKDDLLFTTITTVNKTISLAIDTSISKSLLASEECQICLGGKFPKEGTNSSAEQNFTKSYNIYTGEEWSSSFYFTQDMNTISQNHLILNYILFKNITLRSSFSLTGYLSMSYANENLTKSMSKFALDFQGEQTYLDLNETNQYLNTSNEQAFNVTVSNDTWYLQFDTLVIKKQGQNISNFSLPTEDYKYNVTLDSTTWYIKIPKDFFFNNLEQLFPPTEQCQVQIAGYFLCSCNSSYAYEFPTFYFKNSSNDNDTFQIKPLDYIQYVASIGNGENCFVYYNVNYDNNQWITGINVMNNYYCVFDLKEKKFLLYDKIIGKQTNRTFTVFIIVAAISTLVLFGGHFIYKKFVVDRNNEEE